MEPPVVRQSQDVGPFYYIDCNKFSAEDVVKLESEFEQLAECPVQFNPLYEVNGVVITNCGHIFQRENFNNRPCPSCNNVVKYTWEDKSFSPITGRVHAILLEFKNRIAGQKGFVEVTDLVRELDDFSLKTAGAYILRCGHVHSSENPGSEVILDRVSDIKCIECSEKSTTRIPHFAFRDVRQFINKVKAVAELHQNKIVVIHPAQEMMREASKGNLKEYSKKKLNSLFNLLSTVNELSPVWDEAFEFFMELLKNHAGSSVIKEFVLKARSMSDPVGLIICEELNGALCHFLANTKNGAAYFDYLKLLDELNIKVKGIGCYSNGCSIIMNDCQFLTRTNIDALLAKDANLFLRKAIQTEVLGEKEIELVKLLLIDTSFISKLDPEVSFAIDYLFLMAASSDREVALTLLRLKGRMLSNPPIIKMFRIYFETWAVNCLNAPENLQEAIAEISANTVAIGASAKVKVDKEKYKENYLKSVFEIFTQVSISSADDTKYCAELKIRVMDLYLSKNIISNAWIFLAGQGIAPDFQVPGWTDVLHRLVSKTDKCFYLQTSHFLPIVTKLIKAVQSKEEKLKLLEATKIYIQKMPKLQLMTVGELIVSYVVDIGNVASDAPSDYIAIVKQFISSVRDTSPTFLFNYFELLFLIPSSTKDLLKIWKEESKYMSQDLVEQFNHRLGKSLRASHSGRAIPEGSPPKKE